MTERQHHRTLDIVERLERKSQKKIERRGRRNLGALALLTTTALGLSLYWADVHENQQIEETASTDVDFLYEPLDEANSDSAVVFMDGFGTYDADILTKYLGPVVQQAVDGELWSVSYGNAPLNAENITRDIIELAEERDIDRVSLVGYSAGGIISMQVAEDLLEQTDLKVEAIIPISTPDGTNGLRPARQEEMKAIDWLGYIPGSAYSTGVRQVGEMYFRRDQFTEGDPVQNWNNFWKVWNIVGDAIEDERIPGTWLLVDQVLAISNANLEARLDAIGDVESTQQKPVIMYLGTAKPGYDYMVDDNTSSENICSYADKAGLQCYIYDVPGAIHTRPDLKNEEYMQTVADATDEIQDAIDIEERRLEVLSIISEIENDEK